MNNRAINCVDLICNSCGCSRADDLHVETVARSTFKLFYIFRGSCVMNIDGVSRAVETDCSVLVFPFQRFRIERAEGLKFFWLEFSGFEAAAIVSQTSFTRELPAVGRLNLPGFELLFGYPDCGSDEIYIKYRNSAVIFLIFSYYFEHYPAAQSRENSYVYAARQFIEDNYRSHGFCVSAVVDHLKIDRSYFYRLFKNETGLSPVDYINRRRISQAETLLSNSSLSIKDVAFSVGFTDQMYFSRVFKRLNGQPPSEFRRLILFNSETGKPDSL